MSEDESDSLEVFGCMQMEWVRLVENGFFIVDSNDEFRKSCGACKNVDAIRSVCEIHNVSVNMECWSCRQFSSAGEFRIDSEIPASAWFSLEMTAKVAYDGAKLGDPDCQFIVGAYCSHSKMYQVIREKVSEDEGVSVENVYSDRPDLISASHWFTLAAEQGDEFIGAKLARRMLDSETPSIEKCRNIEMFWKYCESMLEKSRYFTNM